MLCGPDMIVYTDICPLMYADRKVQTYHTIGKIYQILNQM